MYNGYIRCIKTGPNAEYTVDKVYLVLDGKFSNDRGLVIYCGDGIRSFDEWNHWSSAEWEEVEASDHVSFDGFTMDEYERIICC